MTDNNNTGDSPTVFWILWKLESSHGFVKPSMHKCFNQFTFHPHLSNEKEDWCPWRTLSICPPSWCTTQTDHGWLKRATNGNIPAKDYRNGLPHEANWALLSVVKFSWRCYLRTEMCCWTKSNEQEKPCKIMGPLHQIGIIHSKPHCSWHIWITKSSICYHHDQTNCWYFTIHEWYTWIFYWTFVWIIWSPKRSLAHGLDPALMLHLQCVPEF